MSKPKKRISARTVISIITLILVAFVVWNARDQIFQAFNYLSQTNLWFIIALIPEQLLLYISAGQMFFSYMSAKKNATKIKLPTLARISFELNFVNHAIPSGGVAGLGYMSWRLLPFGSSIGQTTFMYVLRYIITICTKQIQVFIALIVLFCIGGVPEGAEWVAILTTFVCLGILGGLCLILVIANKRDRIAKFARWITRLINRIIAKLTSGRKKDVIKSEKIEKYLTDIHHDIVLAKRNKKILIKPILWGFLYSFLEVATFWLVAISMGHPEIFPQIIVGDVLATLVGAVLPTPGGVGGFEGVMIFIMGALNIEVGLATAVVVTTRVIILLNTIVSGYGFYQNAIAKVGKKEKEQILQGKPSAK